jgi:4-hydroxy-3-polyprenylbenzoate decarboxylase
MAAPSTIVIAVTGASGALYAERFLRQAVERCREVHLVISEPGTLVLRDELDLAPDQFGAGAANLTRYAPDDLHAPFASGSQAAEAMVIVPCSLGTAGRVAAGVSDDLITRAADVMLKERRPLVMVPRETPLNLVHLRNLTALAEAGATILPAMPGFYQRPTSIEELIEFVTARIWSVLSTSVDR